MTNQDNTPKGLRPHIVLVGKRNAGKSSLINALTEQNLSIVSSIPGTTTDPVEKAYELQPFGPVVFIDTAGLDDSGELGELRISKTQKAINRADIIVVVINEVLDEKLEAIIKNTQDKKLLYVINKIDLLSEVQLEKIKSHPELAENKPILCSALSRYGIEPLKERLNLELSGLEKIPALMADLVESSDTVVLVIPIDKEAPQGRLILPQVQVIRELLDLDTVVVVVKERELHYALKHGIKNKPKIVVTDSQAFLKVSADVPDDIGLTSFSILLARQKGDLRQYVEGIKAVNKLKTGDKVLISELCSHRPISEDIGRVKIPRWLKQHTGLNLDFEVNAGQDFPEDLSPYSLIIQCGGCMVNRPLIKHRIQQATTQQVPITNYGVVIAYMHGILERAIRPFNL